MDIDEFLEREMKGEGKEEGKDKPIHQATQEEAPVINVEGSIKHFLELWGKISELKLKWDSKLYKEIIGTKEKAQQELYKAAVNLDRDKKAIKKLIGKALDEMDKGSYEEASHIYSDISKMKDSLPDFMAEEKRELNSEILAIYQKLHNGMDNKLIADSKKVANTIDLSINDAALSLAAGDLEKAKVLYEKIVESYKALPNGIMQKKLELGERMLKLYKDLSIQAEINELQQELSTKPNTYNNVYGRLKELSAQSQGFAETINPPLIEKSMEDRGLLNRLVSRKLERARFNLKKELYIEAKRNLESVLKVDPDNREARKLLSSIPIKI